MDRKTCSKWKHNNKTGSRNIWSHNKEGAAVGNKVNLVVLVDGRENGDTKYLFLDEGSFVKLKWIEEESNMGDGHTLYNFLNMSIGMFPADHYALFVLSTHGSGWQGLGVDLSGGSIRDLDLLDMKEYKAVLSNITNQGKNKIDLVAFDICVTASIEVAYQLSPYVRYMVGTEEHDFGINEYADEGYSLGWNYSAFLMKLRENPSMNGEEFARCIVKSYRPGTYTFKIFDRYTAPKWYPILKCYTTLSAINLSGVRELVKSIDSLAINLSQESKKLIKNARETSREYGKLYRKFWFLPFCVYKFHLDPLGYNCFVDIGDFVEKLGKYSSVLSSLQETIVFNKTLPTDHSHGLFIYFPQYRWQYDVSIWYPFPKDFISYGQLDFSKSTHWDEFLKNYLDLE